PLRAPGAAADHRAPRRATDARLGASRRTTGTTVRGGRPRYSHRDRRRSPPACPNPKTTAGPHASAAARQTPVRPSTFGVQAWGSWGAIVSDGAWTPVVHVERAGELEQGLGHSLAGQLPAVAARVGEGSGARTPRPVHRSIQEL